jgi:uncharacterized protein YjbJ (UPF0337 family)
VGGTTDKIKGRMKETVGAATGNQRLKQKGQADQVAGKIKKVAERVIDKVKK